MYKALKPWLIPVIFAWVATQAFYLLMQDWTLREFYGEGNYERYPANFEPIGNMLGVDYLQEIRAKIDSDLVYNCDHVRKVDGTKPTMSVPDEKAPVCCLLGEDQYLIPYKEVGGVYNSLVYTKVS